MVDILSMVDLTSISAMLAAIGVTVGVVFAILELRNLVKARQTDLIIRLYSTFTSKEFQEAWEKVRVREFEDFNSYMKKYGSSEVDQVSLFFEGVGILLHRKLIDISLVDDLFTGPVNITWKKWKPMQEAYRKHYNQPTIAEWFEYLYNEMQKREQRLQQI